jgi:hypothetical protein
MILRTTPAADEDVAYLADHLEVARPGYGSLFLTDYRKALQNIELFPQMYPEVDDGVAGLEIRNAILTRFDLRVVYVILPAEAVILATVHSRRHPTSWHYRLSDLS